MILLPFSGYMPGMASECMLCISPNYHLGWFSVQGIANRLFFKRSLSIWIFKATLLILGCFPGGPAGKESTCNVGDLDSIPGLGRSPGEGNGYPLQYSGLENSMECIVHGVARSRTWLSNFHVPFSWFLSIGSEFRVLRNYSVCQIKLTCMLDLVCRLSFETSEL